MDPLDPCGTIMDVTRVFPKAPCRYYKDRPDLVSTISWYKAPAGAKLFPVPHRFGVRYYSRVDGPYPLGQQTRLGAYLNGHRLSLGDGQHYCGTQDEYQNGAVFDPFRVPSLSCCGIYSYGIASLTGQVGVTLSWDEQVSGEMSLLGSSNATLGIVSLVQGTLSLTGTADAALTLIESSQGTLTLSGQSSVVSGLVPSSQGTLTLSGPTTALLTSQVDVSGEVSLTGNVSVEIGSMVKAWALITRSGTTYSVAAGVGVGTITRVSTGIVQVALSPSAPSADIAPFVEPGNLFSHAGNGSTIRSRSAAGVEIVFFDTTPAVTDPEEFYISFVW